MLLKAAVWLVCSMVPPPRLTGLTTHLRPLVPRDAESSRIPNELKPEPITDA